MTLHGVKMLSDDTLLLMTAHCLAGNMSYRDGSRRYYRWSRRYHYHYHTPLAKMITGISWHGRRCRQYHTIDDMVGITALATAK